MVPKSLKKALRDFKRGKINEREIEALLENLSYQDLGYAKVDHHRALRQGFAEVVFGRGKSEQQILGIADAILSESPNLLITRTDERVFERLKSQYPEAELHPHCKAVTVVREKTSLGRGKIGVFSAGTADMSVAEEAVVTAQVSGLGSHGYQLLL